MKQLSELLAAAKLKKAEQDKEREIAEAIETDGVEYCRIKRIDIVDGDWREALRARALRLSEDEISRIELSATNRVIHKPTVQTNNHPFETRTIRGN